MIIKTSIAVEGLNGSAGGVTAAKNRSRMYFKNRISPRNPRTTAQLSVRGRLSSSSKAWRGLTQEQRMQWDEFSKTETGRRILGEAAKISGFNVFVRVANNLALIGQAIIDVPPTVPEFPVFEITGVTYTAASGDTPASLSLAISGLSSIAGKTIVVRATGGFSAGRASFPTQLRDLGTYTAIASGALNVYDDYAAKFGEVPGIGQKVQFEVFLIDNTSGIASLRQTFVWLHSA